MASQNRELLTPNAKKQSATISHRQPRYRLFMGGLLVGFSLVASGCAREDGGAPVTWGNSPNGQNGRNIVTGSTNEALGPGEVRVQQGDTVYGLARGYGVAPHTIVSLNGLRPPYNLEPGQIVKVPASEYPSALNTNYAAASRTSSPTQQTGGIRVGAGDGLYKLARNYNVDPHELARVNGLHPPYVLHPGQTLRLPDSTASYATAAASSGQSRGLSQGQVRVGEGDSLYSIARKHGVSPSELASANQLRVPYALNNGQILRLPGSNASVPASQIATSSVVRSAPTSQSVGHAQTITIERGDSIYSVARQYDLNPKKLAHYNHLQPPYVVQAGQQLKLPAGATAVNTANNTATTTNASATASNYTVRSGDTLYSIARRHNVSVQALQSMNQLSGSSTISPGQVLSISANNTATKVAKAPTPAQVPAKKINPNSMGGPEIMVERLDEPKANTAAAKPKAVTTQQDTVTPKSTIPQSTTPPAAEKHASAASKPEVASAPKATAPSTPIQTASIGKDGFIWPVKGTVISGYGPKPNGLQNDGINISVRKGTPVRAAKSGTVTYAGQELKGYGKLLLIRHSDGYVTAYAHNSRLLVRPGDSVRQGDVVAESGDSGYVESPQLHFEIRQGRKSVDPSKFFGDMG